MSKSLEILVNSHSLLFFVQVRTLFYVRLKKAFKLLDEWTELDPAIVDYSSTIF